MGLQDSLCFSGCGGRVGGSRAEGTRRVQGENKVETTIVYWEYIGVILILVASFTLFHIGKKSKLLVSPLTTPRVVPYIIPSKPPL